MSSLGDIIGLLGFGALRVEITNEIDVISHDILQESHIKCEYEAT